MFVRYFPSLFSYNYFIYKTQNGKRKLKRRRIFRNKNSRWTTTLVGEINPLLYLS